MPPYPDAVLLNGSNAVTTNVNANPAVADDGADTANRDAAAAATLTDDVPVTPGLAVSVAVTVREPAVTSVAENVPEPPDSDESAGNTTPDPTSDVVKCTVPP